MKIVTIAKHVISVKWQEESTQKMLSCKEQASQNWLQVKHLPSDTRQAFGASESMKSVTSPMWQFDKSVKLFVKLYYGELALMDQIHDIICTTIQLKSIRELMLRNCEVPVFSHFWHLRVKSGPDLKFGQGWVKMRWEQFKTSSSSSSACDQNITMTNSYQGLDRSQSLF